MYDKYIHTDADLGTCYTVVSDSTRNEMKCFMSIFDPIFASTASVRVPQHTSAVLYFLNILLLSFYPCRNKGDQKWNQKVLGFFPLFTSVTNVDFWTFEEKKKVLSCYFDFEKLISIWISQMTNISMFLKCQFSKTRLLHLFFSIKSNRDISKATYRITLCKSINILPKYTFEIL